jgi:hypothetical protein
VINIKYMIVAPLATELLHGWIRCRFPKGEGWDEESWVADLARRRPHLTPLREAESTSYRVYTGRWGRRKLGERSHSKHVAPLGEVASGRGQSQFAVFYAFGANELVSDAANFPALPPEHQHLEAVFRIQVDM